MAPSELAAACEQFLSSRLPADPAHDISHIKRVVKTSIYLSELEGSLSDIVLPAAWLHDCVPVAKDDPRRRQASRLSADTAQEFLARIGYPRRWLEAIGHAIEAHSWSAGVEPETLEARVVQDADRLDALGAVGLARWLMVGGALGRPLLDPTDPFCERREPNDDLWTIDHYFTKLRRIPESMRTEAGRLEGYRRLAVLDGFIDDLKRELGG